MVLLLCGGDKGSQVSDIVNAKQLAADGGKTYGFEDHPI
jgi:putative component of toxin-antitoxin plasmid stabilization module